MDASTLRSMQQPVKDAYRRDPASAITPAHAEGVVEMETLTCRLVGGVDGRLAGLHRAVGGTGEFACSADLLLEALVACAGVTFAAVATARSLNVRSARVIADGVWDARGTLGVDREAAVGLTDVTLTFDLDCDADEATRKRLIDVVERCCVVAQTLVHPPRFTTETHWA